MAALSFKTRARVVLLAIGCNLAHGCTAPAAQMRVVSVESPRERPSADAAPEPRDEAFTLVLARVAIGRSGEAATAWRDIEVQGPYRIARGTCESLVRRELAVRYPPETRLENRPDRPCSAASLGEPPFDAPFVLARTDWPTGAALVLEGVSDVPEPSPLKIRRRHASAFADKASCDAALLRIETASAEARARAKESVATFLDAAVHVQEENVRSACKAQQSVACAQANALLDALRNRTRRTSYEPRPSREEVEPTNVCYRF